MRLRLSITLATLVLVTFAACGCSHPAAWIAQPDLHTPGGLLGPAEVAGYDTNGDHRLDYLQIYNAAGVKRRLAFDTKGAGAFDQVVDLDQAPDSDARYLIFLLDGVSYEVMADLYAQGHFRLFYPPGRLIPGFPTDTDTIYADFFDAPRPFGSEALYFDKDANRLVGGNDFYLKGGNEPLWPERLLYREDFLFDGVIYALPAWVSGRELDKSVGAASDWLQKTNERYAVIYCVSTDGLAHKEGWAALKDYLIRVDQAIEKLVWLSHGKLRIVSLADHALNEAPMKRVAINEALAKAGFNVTDHLQTDRDVVVPAFGLLSDIAVSTRDPARVAVAAVKIAGVDLAAYADGPAVCVVSANGAARVEASADRQRYRYVPAQGDPLKLQPIIEQLRAGGKVDAEGWASPAVWLEATWNHDYPDPLVRLIHAFSGNVRHPPDVFLSLLPDYYYGQSGFDAFATLRGTHGSLRQCTTTTYVLSNFFAPPPYQRTTELRDFLKQRLNLPTLLPPERRPAASPAPTVK